MNWDEDLNASKREWTAQWSELVSIYCVFLLSDSLWFSVGEVDSGLSLWITAVILSTPGNTHPLVSPPPTCLPLPTPKSISFESSLLSCHLYNPLSLLPCSTCLSFLPHLPPLFSIRPLPSLLTSVCSLIKTRSDYRPLPHTGYRNYICTGLFLLFYAWGFGWLTIIYHKL